MLSAGAWVHDICRYGSFRGMAALFDHILEVRYRIIIIIIINLSFLCNWLPALAPCHYMMPVPTQYNRTECQVNEDILKKMLLMFSPSKVTSKIMTVIQDNAEKFAWSLMTSTMNNHKSWCPIESCSQQSVEWMGLYWIICYSFCANVRLSQR